VSRTISTFESAAVELRKRSIELCFVIYVGGFMSNTYARKSLLFWVRSEQQKGHSSTHNDVEAKLFGCSKSQRFDPFPRYLAGGQFREAPDRPQVSVVPMRPLCNHQPP